MVVARSFSYQSARANLHLRAAAYNQQLDRYTQSEDFSLESSARQLVEQFTDKETMELQIVGSSGHVLVSSTGFTPSVSGMPDYTEALSSDDGIGVWNGPNSNGENVMALSTIVTDSTGQALGALRYVVSLAQVDRQIVMTLLMTLVIGLVVIGIVILSNMVFINSIIRSITGIGQAARQIALGDYDASIQKTHDDEIGDLCDTINYMAGEIGDAERMKNEFISSVSHELRTPLTAIQGWAETLCLDIDAETMQKGMHVIVNETERLSRMVEELLDFSRMQSGRLTVQPEPMDILAELGDAVLIYMEKAKREHIRMIYQEPEMLPFVYGDKNRIRQVFINVIDNALKYSNPGGLVTVSAEAVAEQIQVRISDNGVGISAADLPKVKTKFFKANHTRRGSGIGLAVANEIITMHQGKLDLQSELGKGTTVIITLPAMSDHLL